MSEVKESMLEELLILILVTMAIQTVILFVLLVDFRTFATRVIPP